MHRPFETATFNEPSFKKCSAITMARLYRTVSAGETLDRLARSNSQEVTYFSSARRVYLHTEHPRLRLSRPAGNAISLQPLSKIKPEMKLYGSLLSDICYTQNWHHTTLLNKRTWMNNHMTIHEITTCCCKTKTWQCDKILADLLRWLTGYVVFLTYGSEVQGRGFNFWQRRSRSNADGMAKHWPSDVPFSNYLA